MKKYLIAASLMLSVSVFAQKDELKALKKLTNKDEMPNMQEFKQLLDAAEATLGNADQEQKADFYYYKGQYAVAQMMMNPATAQKNLDLAIESLNKVIELEKGLKRQPRTEEIQQQVYPELRAALINQHWANNKIIKLLIRYMKKYIE